MSNAMKRAKFILIAIGVILLVCVVASFFLQKRASEPRETSSTKAVAHKSQRISKKEFSWQYTNQQMPPANPQKYDPSLPQWQEYWRRTKEDKKWEWKIPITFYGKVIDQFDMPVVGANVRISWTNLSVKGSSERELVSDARGLFAVSGINGKHLGVNEIRKEGYANSAVNPRGFEYAAFFDESYYVPDAKKPVIFRMHKKMGTEPLIVISNKYRIPANGAIAVDLKTGQQGGNDILIELVDNNDPTGKKWVARVSAPSGGLQVADSEFATVAPESGYESETIIDQDTVQPTGFQSGSLYKGGKFYVKAASGYALVEFRMIPGNKSLHFTSYLNPNPSSRNLEFDPTRQSQP